MSSRLLFALFFVSVLFTGLSACKKNTIDPGPKITVNKPGYEAALNKKDSIPISLEVYDYDGLESVNVNVKVVTQDGTNTTVADIFNQDYAVSEKTFVLDTKFKVDTTYGFNNMACRLITTAKDKEGSTSQFISRFGVSK